MSNSSLVIIVAIISFVGLAALIVVRAGGVGGVTIKLGNFLFQLNNFKSQETENQKAKKK